MVSCVPSHQFHKGAIQAPAEGLHTAYGERRERHWCIGGGTQKGDIFIWWLDLVAMYAFLSLTA